MLQNAWSLFFKTAIAAIAARLVPSDYIRGGRCDGRTEPKVR